MVPTTMRLATPASRVSSRWPSGKIVGSHSTATSQGRPRRKHPVTLASAAVLECGSRASTSYDVATSASPTAHTGARIAAIRPIGWPGLCQRISTPTAA